MRIEQLEQQRIFCRHGLEHLLDVARIAWILTMEDQLPLDKEIVYSLHPCYTSIIYFQRLRQYFSLKPPSCRRLKTTDIVADAAQNFSHFPIIRM